MICARASRSAAVAWHVALPKRAGERLAVAQWRSSATHLVDAHDPQAARRQPSEPENTAQNAEASGDDGEDAQCAADRAPVGALPWTPGLPRVRPAVSGGCRRVTVRRGGSRHRGLSVCRST
jgi:hypothetical protein